MGFFNIVLEIVLCTLWDDGIFGRHALLSRGWGIQDKRSIEPFSNEGPGWTTTCFCAMANCPV